MKVLSHAKRARLLCLLSLAIPWSLAQEAAYDNLLVFGDSYSDTCNTVRSSEYDFPNCPPAPNGRFTGGHSWPEMLQAVTPGLSVWDYAYGGATCNNSIIDRGQEMDMVSQVSSFLDGTQNAGSLDPDRTLAALWIGTNELVTLVPSLSAPDVLDSYMQLLGGCIKGQVQQLLDAGLQHIMLFQLIPLQFSAGLGGAFANITEALVQTKNALDGTIIAEMQAQYPNATFQAFPIYDLFINIVASPESYLGADVHPYDVLCSLSTVHNLTTVDPCDGFIFWDVLHPTQAIWNVLVPELQPYFLQQAASSSDPTSSTSSTIDSGPASSITQLPSTLRAQSSERSAALSARNPSRVAWLMGGLSIISASAWVL